MPDESNLNRRGKVFSPLARSIDLTPKEKVTELMFRLVRDELAYARYERDPSGTLKAAGIGPRDVDPRIFAQVAKDLNDRAHGRKNPVGHQMTQMTSKQSETGQQWNFDHSQSATKNYNTDTSTTQGQHSETSTSETAGTTKDFAGVSIVDTDSMLRHEIGLLFYPSQPLVTPTLIDRIKGTLLGRKSI